MPTLLSTAEVADVLSVDRKTVLRYLNNGKLKGHKIGREYRIAESDLQTFLQKTSNDGPRHAEAGRALVTVLVNQKGGVGKTTSTLNLGVALCQLGKRTLMVDMDPQASLTISAGIDLRSLEMSVHDVLIENDQPAGDVVLSTKMGPDLLPSTIDLSASEILLVNEYKREYRLRDKLSPLHETYDHILIDAPPSLGILTVNTLSAADRVIVPIQCEYLAMRGIQLLLQSIERATSNLNPSLTLFRILPTMYDKRTVHAGEVLEELRKAFPGLVFDPVPHRVSVKEAPAGAMSIFDYDPDGAVADVYMQLAKEVADHA